MSSFHFYHRTLNQACSAAKSPNASLQCAWNSLLWNCGIFLVYPFVFCQALVQGTGGFTDGSREGCSQCAWDAVAFWVLPEELRAGHNVHRHEQNTVICASGTLWTVWASSAHCHGCCHVHIDFCAFSQLPPPLCHRKCRDVSCSL